MPETSSRFPAHLEIHDGLRDLYIDGFDNHNNIEGAKHTFRNLIHGQGKVLPLGVEFVQIVQATLDDIHTVIGAGLLRVALAGAAMLHLGQCTRAVGIETDLCGGREREKKSVSCN